MLKKLTMLAMAVGVLVAFAVPAVASAQEFYTDPGEVTLTEPTIFTATGSMSSTVGGVTTGPFVFHADGYLWNEPTGVGIIEKSQITGPFGVSPLPPSCQATATNSTESGAEWPVRAVGSGNVVAIEEVAFINHYNAACQAFGLPATVAVTGTLTGIYNNATGTVDFVNAGHLKAGEINIVINGSVTLIDAGGEKFTLR